MDSSEIRDEIVRAVPVESYIGKYVKLKKTGKSYSGLCPFHQEKSPSFTVTPEKGLYHCFGCGKGGDLFRFVMDYEHVSFPEALAILAAYAGIELKSQGSDSHKRLYDLNGRVALYYASLLQGKPRDYLKGRGLTEEAIEHFQIGYSSPEKNALQKQFPAEEGLASLRLINNGYDFFRGRIMFPIRTYSGRVAGFGGRKIADEDFGPKYLNSAESAIFRKNDLFYGLSDALPAIRRSGRVYVVEGYLDVMGLWQSAAQGAVAPLGTAFNARHLQILKRYAREIVAIYDGDAAGRKAALKFARLAVDHGEEASLVLLPRGLDPFDLCQALSPPEVHNLLERTVPTDYFLIMETMFPDIVPAASGGIEEQARELQDYYLGKNLLALPGDLGGRKKARDLFFELYRNIQRPSNKELYLEHAALLLRMSRGALKEELGGETRNAPVAKAAVRKSALPASGPFAAIERRLMVLCLLEPEAFREEYETLSRIEWRDDPALLLFQLLEYRAGGGRSWLAQEITESGDLPPEIAALFRGFLLSAAGTEDGSVETAVAEVRELCLKHELAILNEELGRLKKDALEERFDLIKRVKALEEELRLPAYKREN
ncbi:MAG: DNA primase [Spirochaetales bacterium]|nr:DNA primase [Spirochaetales bacterium]